MRVRTIQKTKDIGHILYPGIRLLGDIQVRCFDINCSIINDSSCDITALLLIAFHRVSGKISVYSVIENISIPL